MNDYISRQAAIDRQAVLRILTDISYNICKTEAGADDINTAKLMVIAMPDAEPDKTYEQGWKDGQEALRKEMWKDGRDRLD